MMARWTSSTTGSTSTGTPRGRAVIPEQDLLILLDRLGGSADRQRAVRGAADSRCGAVRTYEIRKIGIVVKDDDTVEARPVVLGPLDEGLRVVREGLKAEDRVIVDGIERARVGAKVSRMRQPAAETHSTSVVVRSTSGSTSATAPSIAAC